MNVLEELLKVGTAPAAPSSSGAGELPETQPRPTSLRMATKRSLKKACRPIGPDSSGNNLREHFVLCHRPESSAVGLSVAAAPVGPSVASTVGPSVDSANGGNGPSDASAIGPSVASRSSIGHPVVDLLAVVSTLKRVGKLVDANGNPLDLHQLFRAGHISVRWMLNQLYTYMVSTGVEFGFLSCFYFTWIAWRPLSSPDCLQLSGPFKHDTSAASGGITTIAALSWIQDLAMERTIGQAIRHAPYVRLAATCDKGGPDTRDVEVDGADADADDGKDCGGGDEDSRDGVGGSGCNKAGHVQSAAACLGGDGGSKRYLNED